MGTSISKCHFILTSDELIYLYYLSIASALKTQKADKFFLWAFGKLQGKYWQVIKDRVELVIIPKPDFPALRNKPPHFQYAHLKDWIVWNVLYKHGGLYLDLDNFCVADIFTLWDNSKDVMVNLQFREEVPVDYLYHAGCMMVKPKMLFMHQIIQEADILFNGDGDMDWGKTGPPLMSRVINSALPLDKVNAIAPGILGGCADFIWGCKDPLTFPGKLWEQAKVIHVYGGKRSETIREINEEYIRTNRALFPEIVKQHLTEEEWDPLNVVTHKEKAIMPTSHPEAISPILNLIMQAAPKSVLDVGVGFGKNGLLCREYLDIWYGRVLKESWQTQIDGLEVFPKYDNPNWHYCYNNIIVGNIVDNLERLGQYDLVLLIDVIEHLTKDDGIAVLEAIQGAYIVSTPRRFYQANVGTLENTYKLHVSRWYPSEFDNTLELSCQLIGWKGIQTKERA